MEVLFSFGTWEGFPFQRSYIIINAVDSQTALNEFRRRFPDLSPGTYNFADMYTKAEHIRDFKKNGNLGKGCHLYVDLIKNIEQNGLPKNANDSVLNKRNRSDPCR